MSAENVRPLSVAQQPSTPKRPRQVPMLVALRAIVQSLPDKPLLDCLRAYRPRAGRPGFPLRAMWRAYVASFVMNLPSTNALIRALRDDPRLRRLCGFDPNKDRLPTRRTFNRFIQRLDNHSDLVEAMLTRITHRLKDFLPDMGDVVAIDATPLRSHSRKATGSDPEAGWAVANSPQTGKKYVWGYKVHLIADAVYGLPLSIILTEGNHGDALECLPLVRKATSEYHWLTPTAAVADRAYDSRAIHESLWNDYGIIPVMRLRSGTPDGPPVCEGGMDMRFMGIDREKRRVYQCPKNGCPLKYDKPGGQCTATHRLDPMKDIRKHGVIRRESKQWSLYYRLRKAIERVFKSMKESRRLERHCVRGLRGIRLHALMSALTFSATALMNAEAGHINNLGWMVSPLG